MSVAGHVVVTLVGGSTIEGTLFCVDPVTKSVVVQHEDGRLTVVNHLHMSKVEGDLTPPTPDIASMGLSVSNMEKREELAMRTAEKNLDSINKNVSPMVQTLFERVAWTFSDTKWVGNQIVILSNIIVDQPYKEARVQDGGANTQLEFVQKILQGARDKLGFSD